MGYQRLDVSTRHCYNRIKRYLQFFLWIIIESTDTFWFQWKPRRTALQFTVLEYTKLKVIM